MGHGGQQVPIGVTYQTEMTKKSSTESGFEAESLMEYKYIPSVKLRPGLDGKGKLYDSANKAKGAQPPTFECKRNAE